MCQSAYGGKQTLSSISASRTELPFVYEYTYFGTVLDSCNSTDLEVVSHGLKASTALAGLQRNWSQYGIKLSTTFEVFRGLYLPPWCMAMRPVLMYGYGLVLIGTCTNLRESIKIAFYLGLIEVCWLWCSLSALLALLIHCCFNRSLHASLSWEFQTVIVMKLPAMCL